MYSLSYTCSGAELYSLYAPGKLTSISRAHELSASRARRLIDKHVITHIIDVRNDLEWDHGHHSDAKHIPFQMFSESILKRFEVKKDDSILIYCGNGHRAKNASDLLKSFGFKNVYYITTSYESIELNPFRTPSSVKCASPPSLVATA